MNKLLAFITGLIVICSIFTTPQPAAPSQAEIPGAAVLQTAPAPTPNSHIIVVHRSANANKTTIIKRVRQ